ncbi:MAG: 50S ribosomal protein L13 [Firmicutes bacterium]|nr:50S ribosomal protein L13 [Bacillota bacterium]
MKTYFPTLEKVERKWHVIDLAGKNLGRAATEIARILTGKIKPEFTPNIDVGDFVVVVNADKFTVTGNKLVEKEYRRHSGYPGGLKSINLKDLIKKYPERAIKFAVMGMLPKNKLRPDRMKRLKVYTTATHPHQAQNPVEKNLE